MEVIAKIPMFWKSLDALIGIIGTFPETSYDSQSALQLPSSKNLAKAIKMWCFHAKTLKNHSKSTVFQQITMKTLKIQININTGWQIPIKTLKIPIIPIFLEVLGCSDWYYWDLSGDELRQPASPPAAQQQKPSKSNANVILSCENVEKTIVNQWFSNKYTWKF